MLCYVAALVNRKSKFGLQMNLGTSFKHSGLDLDLGADLSARDQWGKTALTAAQDSGKTLAAAYLRSVGAPSGGEDVLLREHTPMAAAGTKATRTTG